MKPRIFIGSSSEGLPTALRVKASLETDFDCVMWNDAQVFGLGVSFLDSLLKAGSMFDFGIMVATKDDQTNSRGKRTDSPRDNVIFEFGLFMGRLGKFRTLILLEAGTKLPSDMEGITISRYTGGKSAAALATLTTQIEILRAHIQERSRLPELGLLPSTGVAMAFYTSFIERICNRLEPVQEETVNEASYSSFEVHVVIPKELQHSMHGQARSYYVAHGFIEYTFDPLNKLSRPIGTRIAPAQNEPGKLLICDVPTILTALYNAIEMYLPKTIGKSKERELIEARELNNFVAVLKVKVNQDSFSRKVVRFIEE